MVVFGQSLGSAWGACLDLACGEADNQISDEVVFSLAGTMRNHDSPPVVSALLVGSNGLSERSDLVDFQKQSIARLLLDSSGNPLLVSDQQIISNYLDIDTQVGSHILIASPVILVEGVFNRDDGVFLGIALVDLVQLCTGDMGH